MKRSGLMLGVAAILAIAIAGCGSTSNSSSTSTSAATTASTPAGTTAATTATGASGTTGATTVIAVKHAGDLGSILSAGSKHLTVYMFEGDHGTSTCTGSCEKVWPPVTTTGEPTVHGAVAADLGTTTRPDGTKQVTYKGQPLYFFVRDKDDGDTYGEGVNGFGADWYVIAPSGNKVDNDDDDKSDSDSDKS
jgi:predicted lipoprotein with Yx(FWY)xxD motif